MSFDWNNYLNLAEELSKREEEECVRSSISRAYYGLFIPVRNLLRNKASKRFHSARDHESFIVYLKTHDDSIANTIGNLLEELRDKRNKADYDGIISLGKRDAIECWRKASEFINEDFEELKEITV